MFAFVNVELDIIYGMATDDGYCGAVIKIFLKCYYFIRIKLKKLKKLKNQYFFCFLTF